MSVVYDQGLHDMKITWNVHYYITDSVRHGGPATMTMMETFSTQKCFTRILHKS